MRGEGVRETLTGVARLVLRHLAEKYGGGMEETPIMPPMAAPTAPAEAATESKPLEVEEIEELPVTEAGGLPATETVSLSAHTSTVEIPIVLDRSLFSGDGPIEIKLKLYIK